MPRSSAPTGIGDAFKSFYFSKNNYWDEIEEEIKQFCKQEKVKFKIYFHHSKK